MQTAVRQWAIERLRDLARACTVGASAMDATGATDMALAMRQEQATLEELAADLPEPQRMTAQAFAYRQMCMREPAGSPLVGWYNSLGAGVAVVATAMHHDKLEGPDDPNVEVASHLNHVLMAVIGTPEVPVSLRPHVLADLWAANRRYTRGERDLEALMDSMDGDTPVFTLRQHADRMAALLDQIAFARFPGRELEAAARSEVTIYHMDLLRGLTPDQLSELERLRQAVAVQAERYYQRADMYRRRYVTELAGIGRSASLTAEHVSQNVEGEQIGDQDWMQQGAAANALRQAALDYEARAHDLRAIVEQAARPEPTPERAPEQTAGK